MDVKVYVKVMAMINSASHLSWWWSWTVDVIARIDAEAREKKADVNF